MSFVTDLEAVNSCTWLNQFLGILFLVVTCITFAGQCLLIILIMGSSYRKHPCYQTMVCMGILNLCQLSANLLYCTYVLRCVMNPKQEYSILDAIIGPFNKIYFNTAEYYNLVLALNRLLTFYGQSGEWLKTIEVVHKALNVIILLGTLPFYLYHFAPGCFSFYSPFLWEVPDPCEYWDVFDFYTVRIAELLSANLLIYLIMLGRMVYLRAKVLQINDSRLNSQERRILLIAVIQFLNSGIATFYNRMWPDFYNYTSAGRIIFRFMLLWMSFCNVYLVFALIGWMKQKMVNSLSSMTQKSVTSVVESTVTSRVYPPVEELQMDEVVVHRSKSVYGKIMTVPKHIRRLTV